jgi:hypothetical protein
MVGVTPVWRFPREESILMVSLAKVVCRRLLGRLLDRLLGRLLTFQLLSFPSQIKRDPWRPIPTTQVNGVYE